MLVTPGDLIPVAPAATHIPWTRRKSQILNHLHRGPVDFDTLVYDTNVGDISPLGTYFNPERVSVHDLNSRFGQTTESEREPNFRLGSEVVVRPRLLLYPEHNLNPAQVKVERTLKWILTQDEDSSKGSGERVLAPKSPEPLTPASSTAQQPVSTCALPDSAIESVEAVLADTEVKFGENPSRSSSASSYASCFNTKLFDQQDTTSETDWPPVVKETTKLTPIGQQLPRLTPIGQPLRKSLQPTLGEALDGVWGRIPLFGVGGDNTWSTPDLNDDDVFAAPSLTGPSLTSTLASHVGSGRRFDSAGQSLTTSLRSESDSMHLYGVPDNLRLFDVETKLSDLLNPALLNGKLGSTW